MSLKDCGLIAGDEVELEIAKAAAWGPRDKLHMEAAHNQTYINYLV